MKKITWRRFAAECLALVMTFSLIGISVSFAETLTGSSVAGEVTESAAEEISIGAEVAELGITVEDNKIIDSYEASMEMNAEQAESDVDSSDEENIGGNSEIEAGDAQIISPSDEEEQIDASDEAAWQDPAGEAADQKDISEAAVTEDDEYDIDAAAEEEDIVEEETLTADEEAENELLDTEISEGVDTTEDIGEPVSTGGDIQVVEEPLEKLPRLGASASSISFTGIDGNKYTPADFDTDYAALFYGRTICDNTQAMIQYLEGRLKADSPSFQIVLMNCDSTKEQLEAYATKYPNRLVSDENNDIYQYFSISGATGTISLPGIIIIDNATGEIAFTANGLKKTELNQFLADIGITDESGTTGELCTFRMKGTADYPAVFEVLDLLNAQREEAGLDPLVMDETLLEVAMQRAAENRYYYSHTRPDGTDCFTLFPPAWGMAENIAAGQLSPKAVMTSWTNSSGHYANMMNEGFTDVGIGCFYDGDTMDYRSVRWVQVFAVGNSRTKAPERGAEKQEFEIEAESDTVELALKTDTISVNVGGSYVLTLLHKGYGSYAYSGAIIPTYYESKDPSIAEIDEDGVVTGNKTGTATVLLGVDENHYAEATVKVTRKADGISLDQESIALKAGEKAALTATVTPADASNKKVRWTSSDEKVATVTPDASGTGCAIKALTGGKAIITATTEDGGYKAECEVKVTSLFTDVTDSAKGYYDAVYWAAANGITMGYTSGSKAGTFGVGENCKRKAFALFLWRYAGCPSGYGDARTMFNDLGSYDTSTDVNKAVAWAYKTEIIKGYADGGFHPDATVSRRNIMVMLYRYAEKPEVSGTLTFEDCKNLQKGTDIYNSILWGYTNGITKGSSIGGGKYVFGINDDCRREHIVLMLYRYNNTLNSSVSAR